MDELKVSEEKIYIGKENIVPVSLEVAKELGLAEAIVYAILSETTCKKRLYRVPVKKLSNILSQKVTSDTSRPVLNALKKLEKGGYIQYERANKYQYARARILKEYPVDFDVDMRWVKVCKAFSRTKIMVLSTIDALGGSATTKEIYENTDLGKTVVMTVLARLRNEGIIESYKLIHEKRIWSINTDLIKGVDSMGNLDRLFELRDYYAKKAEECMDAVKFYQTEINKEINLVNKETKEEK